MFYIVCTWAGFEVRNQKGDVLFTFNHCSDAQEVVHALKWGTYTTAQEIA